MCKSADLLLMVLDASKPNAHREILTRELESVGIRLNRGPPNITVKKKKIGGININSTLPLKSIDEKMVHRILQAQPTPLVQQHGKEACCSGFHVYVMKPFAVVVWRGECTARA